MATYTTISVTRVDGAPIDLIESHTIERVVGEHVELDRMHDGLGWEDDQRVGVSAVGQSGWSKYSISIHGESEAASRALGSDYRLTIDEEWDDEGPGAESVVYVGGERDVVASSSMRFVSDALAHVNLTDPVTAGGILATFDALRALDEHRAGQGEWGDLSDYDEKELDLYEALETAVRTFTSPKES